MLACDLRIKVCSMQFFVRTVPPSCKTGMNFLHTTNILAIFSADFVTSFPNEDYCQGLGGNPCKSLNEGLLFLSELAAGAVGGEPAQHPVQVQGIPLARRRPGGVSASGPGHRSCGRRKIWGRESCRISPGLTQPRWVCCARSMELYGMPAQPAWCASPLLSSMASGTAAVLPRRNQVAS